MTDPGEDFDDLLAALAAPRPPAFEHPLPGPFFQIGSDPPVAIRVGRNQLGFLVCTGLLISWDDSQREVTARGLQALRLGRMLEAVERLDQAGAAELLSLARLASNGRKRPGPAGLPASHYKAVAEAFGESRVKAPRSPSVWLASRWGCSTSTVRRWVREARRRGLLDV